MEAERDLGEKKPDLKGDNSIPSNILKEIKEI